MNAEYILPRFWHILGQSLDFNFIIEAIISHLTEIIFYMLSVQYSLIIVFHALRVAVVNFLALFLLAFVLHYSVVSRVHTSQITTRSIKTMTLFESYYRVPSEYSLLLSKILIIWLASCLFILERAIQGYIMESCNWFSAQFLFSFRCWIWLWT